MTIFLFTCFLTSLWTQTDPVESEDELAYSLAVVPLIFYEPTITSVVARDVLNNLEKTMPDEVDSRVLVGTSSPSETLSQLYDYYVSVLEFDFVVLVEVRALDSTDNTSSGSDDGGDIVEYQLGLWIFTRGFTTPIYVEIFTVEVLDTSRQALTLSTLKINETVQNVDELFASMTDVIREVLEKTDITLIVNKELRLRPQYFIRIADRDDIYPDRKISTISIDGNISRIEMYQVIKKQEQYIASYPIYEKQKFYTLEVPFIMEAISLQTQRSHVDVLLGGQLPLFSVEPNIFLGGFAVLTRYRFNFVKDIEDVMFPYLGVGAFITYAQSGTGENLARVLQMGLNANSGVSFIVRDENQFTVGGSLGMLINGTPKGYEDFGKNSSLLLTTSIDSGYTRHLVISDKLRLRFIVDISFVLASGLINASPSVEDVVDNNVSYERRVVFYMAGYGFLGVGIRF